MPTKGPARVFRTIGIIVLVLGALLWLLQIYAGSALRAQLRKQLHTISAEWIEQDSTRIDVDLFRGNASVGPLALIPMDGPDGAIRISGKFELVQVRGLSYWKLLFGGDFFVEELQLVANSVLIELPRESGDKTAISSSSITAGVGSLKLDLRDLVLRTPEQLEVSLGAFYGSGSKLSSDFVAGASPSFTFESCELVLLQASVSPLADSILGVELLEWDLDQGELMLAGLNFGVKDVMALAPTVGIERDVVAGAVQEVQLSGVDVQEMLEGRFHARSLRLGKAEVRIARDKLLEDPAFVHKPLPARLIRNLPPGSGIDTVLVEDLAVDYYERVDAERGFGHIPFRAIQGELLDLRNTEDAVLTLRATATMFAETPVSLELSSAVQDTLDAMKVQASVGQLPFAALHGAIAPLTGVAIPEGQLDTLIMFMTGRDRTGDVRLWMAYEELKIDKKSKKQKIWDPLLDLLLNAAVKTERSNETEEEGWSSYTVERRRDRSVFNYLWTAVREGAKESMTSTTAKAVL